MAEYRNVAIGLLEENKGQIEGLPANPRQWTRMDLDSLKKSIEEAPELLEAEQACITIDRGLYEFYKEYFDGIISIVKD